MSGVMWLIAGVNLTVAFQQLPNKDYSHIIGGLIFLTFGTIWEMRTK